MKKIKKVLNSSVVIAEDEQKNEYILLGKGIGYGQKAGNVIQEEQADQVFIPLDKIKSEGFFEILDSIPPIFLELTQEIVLRAEEKLETKLNPGIYFALMDHLNFAVERHKKNIIITNRLFWEVKNYYAEEFRIGLHAVNLVNKRLEITLPEQEAANIAFHLINAQGDGPASKDAMKAAKMTGDIVNMVRYTLNVRMETENIHYNRFLTHVKFFVERFFADKMLEDQDDFLYQQISRSYPNAMRGASKIQDYIRQVYEKEISREELVYLAVHIQRLISYHLE